MISEGEVYSFSQGQVKERGSFNQTNYKYELVFDDSTQIEKLPDNSSIPRYYFNLIKIKDIMTKQIDQVVDLVVIVDKVGEVENFVSKKGNPSQRQNLVFKDEEDKVNVIIWGELTEEFSFREGEVILIQGVQIKEFQGRKIQLMKGSRLHKNVMEVPRFKELHEWHQKNNFFKNQKNLSVANIPIVEIHTIKQILHLSD